MSKWKKREPTTVNELLKDIDDAVAKIKKEQGSGYKGCIFRGEPKAFDKVTSSLYRGLGERRFVPTEPVEETSKKVDQFTRELKRLLKNRAKEAGRVPLKSEFVEAVKEAQSKVIGDEMSYGKYREIALQQLQKWDAKEAKRWDSSKKSDVEILAELQHYGGQANLIDFSECHLVALFFACNDDSYTQNDGRLIILPKRDIEVVPVSGQLPHDKKCILRPLLDNPRATVQKSVMLYEPKGYLERIGKPIEVPRGLKRDILDYLRRNENGKIVPESIFPDIQGYIEYQKFAQTYMAYITRILALIAEKQYRRALHYSNKTLELIGEDVAEPYIMRASAYMGLEEYEKALSDCDEAIKLDSENVRFYEIRGGDHIQLRNYEEALSDSNRALELLESDEGKPELLLLRSKAYKGMKESSKAQADHNRALELDPEIQQKLKDPIRLLT